VAGPSSESKILARELPFFLFLHTSFIQRYFSLGGTAQKFLLRLPSCYRYCVEKVDLSKILGQSPWEKQGLVWIQLLDAVRYLVVWHPIILAVAHFGVRHVLGYHPLVVDQDHPAHADHDHIQHLKPIAPGQ
jgi:hypothetical protein